MSRQPESPAVVVTLYTKTDCPLCDQVRDDLNWLSQEQPLSIDARDIEGDAELYARFRYLIPVVEIDGVLHYPPHDLLQLRSALIEAAKTNEVGSQSNL